MQEWKTLVALIAVAYAAGGASALVLQRFLPEERAKDAIRGGLIDPDSARFQAVVHSWDTGATCGQVNARNRLGGYAGFKAFMVARDGRIFMEPDAGAGDELRSFAQTLVTQCPAFSPAR